MLGCESKTDGHANVTLSSFQLPAPAVPGQVQAGLSSCLCAGRILRVGAPMPALFILTFSEDLCCSRPPVCACNQQPPAAQGPGGHSHSSGNVE